MLLYHGSDITSLESILKKGITTRANSGKYAAQGYSDPNFIYLGYSRSLWYLGNEGEDPILIECNVNKRNLYPDEEFLGTKYKRLGVRKSIKSYIGELELYKDEAIESLKFFGSVAHKGDVKPSKITRIAILNKEIMDKYIHERRYEINTNLLDKNLRKNVDNFVKNELWELPYSSDVIELV